MIRDCSLTKTELAKSLGISRSMLYYEHRQPKYDWWMKQRIEIVLREHPSYGHRRLALHLEANKKRVLRVMRIFGIKPYRRRGRKYRKTKDYSLEYPNLLLTEYPQYKNHIWASDFTYLKHKKRIVYLATVIDLFTKEIAGFSVMSSHSVSLTINALLAAVKNNPVPGILHSDQGSEYTSKDYVALTDNLGIRISISKKASPWENGYQESFYSQFKVDLGDPNRFGSLGELVWAIYKTIHNYNNTRIHTTLKMPPAEFSQRQLQRSSLLLDKVS